MRRFAARAARRLSVHGQDELARTAARRLGSVSDQRIEELMATPLRRPVLDALFWGLPRILSGSPAHELTSSVHFQLIGGHGKNLDGYWIEFRAGRWHSGRGEPEAAHLTIAATGPDLLALAYGRARPIRHYAKRRLRVRGNPIAAARLLSLIQRELAPAGSSAADAADQSAGAPAAGPSGAAVDGRAQAASRRRAF